MFSNTKTEQNTFELRPTSPYLTTFPRALFFIALLCHSRACRAVLFIPILIISYYLIFYTTKGRNIYDMETANTVIVTLFQASDAFLVNDVSKLRLVGQTVDANDLGMWERIKWALMFITTPRQIGWTHEPRHVIPPHPIDARWEFVRRRIIHCFGFYVLADILNTYMCYSPAFWKGELGVSIAHGGIMIRLVHTAMMVALSWSVYGLMYTIMAILAVSVGLTNASEWPALYGNIGDGYNVRRFWGRVWHQGLRRVLTVHADFITFRVLRLSRNRFVGNTVHHYLVFALSGIMHSVTEYGLFRDAFWENSTAMKFFLLQATVIMVEHYTAKLVGIQGRKVGRWTRILGCFWVFFWFSFTFPLWVDPQLRYGFHTRHGFWEKDNKVGSLCHWVWTGDWEIRMPAGTF